VVVERKLIYQDAPITQRHMPKHAILHPSESVCLNPNQCALAIMTKAPLEGDVKTRLVPPLSPAEAAELNACFLSDVAHAISRACAGLPLPAPCQVAVYTPIGAEDVYAGILPRDFFLMPQRGESLGQRLISAVEDLFKIGFGSVCLINSDSPTLKPSIFTEAVGTLADPGERIVLGPSDDGGYYLIGVKRLHLRLFEEMAWSTDSVFQETKQRAAELNLEVHELPAGFDVDDHQGLSRLCDQLLAQEARDAGARRTRNFLREFIVRRGGSGFLGAPRKLSG
jgi:rSAM/selenodomain-associated transferase 1